MDSSNRNHTTNGVKHLDLNICSINICGMSDRSRFALDRYCHDMSLDILALQESGTVDKSNLDLTFMSHISDTNDGANKGAMLYVNNNKLSVTNIPEISKKSKEIDSAWGLVCGKGFRYIVGSVYLKLSYNNAVKDLLLLLKESKVMCHKFGAKGVLLLGDFNARHQLWGDESNNKYGKELVENLSFQDFSIISSSEPTFLSSNGKSFIDFIITSVALEERVGDIQTDNEVELYSGAPLRGHVPILSKLATTSSVKSKPQVKLKLDIGSFDWDSWKNDLESVFEQEEERLSELSAQEHWEFLNKTINSISKKHGKYKKSCIHSKPYWTKELTIASTDLRQAKKNYSKRNTLSNKELLESL